MMSRSSFLVLLAGLTVAAVSLGAQVPTPAVRTDTSFTPWPARPIGTWRIGDDQSGTLTGIRHAGS